MSEFDPIKSLRDAGLLPDAPANHLEEGHQGGLALDVLGTLSEHEVEVLKSIRRRLDAAALDEQEVGAHGEGPVGGGFW
jgi:hypothetical protein